MAFTIRVMAGRGIAVGVGVLVGAGVGVIVGVCVGGNVCVGIGVGVLVGSGVAVAIGNIGWIESVLSYAPISQGALPAGRASPRWSTPFTGKPSKWCRFLALTRSCLRRVPL